MASSEAGAPADRRIGALLAAEGKLTDHDIERVVDLQKLRRIRFGEAAVRLGLIGVDDLRRAMALQYDLPHLLPDNARLNQELVVAFEPFHPCAEQIRALRTQLLMRWMNGGAKASTLAIISPSPHEGRSYVAANLAVAFAQLGRRTLLIDADLRHPRQQQIFGIPDEIGLVAVLSGRADRRAAIVPVRDLGPLSVLPSGARPPNPVELLSHEAFGALVIELQSDFDVILFDTPAAQTCADAQTVAFRARSALLLARKDHTRIVDTERIVREMGDAGTEIVGQAFNAF
jgi:receptor protein-tyrosine kinase